MQITAKELIEELESMDPGAEIKIAYQPIWPMEEPATGLYADHDNQVLYLAGSGTNEYLNPEAAEEFWRM